MRLLDPYKAVIRAVNEVRPPVILATLAVIISFLPMFFITGMMGPYMAPMALNVPVAMLMSLLVAFTITPWLSYHLLRKSAEHASHKEFVLEETWLYRTYKAIMDPLFASPQKEVAAPRRDRSAHALCRLARDQQAGSAQDAPL